MRKSARKDKAFVSVNCAAIPDNLLESELFGHEKGAFTGAIARRIGKFEEANGGTLLLDEISEMDVRLQAKLLRAIQERVIDRVGGSQPVRVDIRIIATSNRNLADEVKKGTFREDLLYRLNVVHLRLPALRERPGGHPRTRPATSPGNTPRRTACPSAPLSADAKRLVTKSPWQGQRAGTREHHAPRGSPGDRAGDRGRRDHDAGGRVGPSRRILRSGRRAPRRRPRP